jgi:hypothetical protein
MATKILQIVDSLVKNADTLDGKHAHEFVASSGWTAGKYLGVDAYGNIVEKDSTGMANVDGETLKITSAVVTVSEEILFL